MVAPGGDETCSKVRMLILVAVPSSDTEQDPASPSAVCFVLS